MSSVVGNLDLLDDVAHQRGLVTLLQQICGQFVSRRLLSVAADEDGQPPLSRSDRRLALIFAVDVFTDRSGDDLVLDAGADQLAPYPQLADALPGSRADECAGEALVVEPFLCGQTLDRRVDVFFAESFRAQLSLQLCDAVESMPQDSQGGRITAVGVVHDGSLTESGRPARSERASRAVAFLSCRARRPATPAGIAALQATTPALRTSPGRGRKAGRIFPLPSPSWPRQTARRHADSRGRSRRQSQRCTPAKDVDCREREPGGRCPRATHRFRT